MPKNQDFKRLVRARMKESGERYTEVRQTLKKSSRLVVAIDTPGLGSSADFQAKTLANKLSEAGFTPRYPGSNRYRTASQVAEEIARVSADAAVLVVEAEGAELLVDDVLDFVDERGSRSSRWPFSAVAQGSALTTDSGDVGWREQLLRRK